MVLAGNPKPDRPVGWLVQSVGPVGWSVGQSVGGQSVGPVSRPATRNQLTDQPMIATLNRLVWSGKLVVSQSVWSVGQLVGWWSVSQLVGWWVGQSVGWLVGQLVGQASQSIEWQSVGRLVSAGSVRSVGQVGPVIQVVPVLSLSSAGQSPASLAPVC